MFVSQRNTKQSAQQTSGDTLHFGANNDLGALVRTHLFILSSNNGGSTFLRRSIENCAHVWSLPREGQHVYGFPGPSTQTSKSPLIWNSTPARRSLFERPGAYDWEGARRTWYFQATARSANANVFVTSSPPFLLKMDELRAKFRGAKFLIMTRHPLAIAEGILRRPIERILGPDEIAAEVVATHVGECLTRLQNVLGDKTAPILHFKYEEMCAKPRDVAQRISAFVPELTDLRFDQKVKVKGRYNEPVRNMNAEAFVRLGPHKKMELIEYFKPYAEVLNFFDYDLQP